MKLSTLKKPEYSSKIAGAVFFIIALLLFLFTQYTTAALGAAFIGLLLVLLIHESTVEEEVAIAGLFSGVSSLNRLLDDLEIDGNAIAVPPGKNLTESRTYIPAGDFNGLPDLYDEMSIVGVEGKTGISLVPVGLPLLELAKNRMKYDLKDSGMEGVHDCLSHLSIGMEMARSYHLKEENGETRLIINLSKYENCCQKLRKESGDLCRKAVCPICSAFITGISEGSSLPIRIVRFERKENLAEFLLEKIQEN